MLKGPQAFGCLIISGRAKNLSGTNSSALSKSFSSVHAEISSIAEGGYIGFASTPLLLTMAHGVVWQLDIGPSREISAGDDNSPRWYAPRTSRRDGWIQSQRFINTAVEELGVDQLLVGHRLVLRDHTVDFFP